VRNEGHILLIDDDSELCSLMAEFFSEHGFGLEAVHDGRSGLARVLEGGFDVVILDVMLPVLDSLQTLAQMRRRLNVGADDYLPKPFGPEELLANPGSAAAHSAHRGREAAGHRSGRSAIEFPNSRSGAITSASTSPPSSSTCWNCWRVPPAGSFRETS
jgi:DNA-binding response OmpR family regulator